MGAPGQGRGRMRQEKGLVERRSLTLEAWAGPAEEGVGSRWSAVITLSTDPEVEEALLLQAQGCLVASGGT